MPKEDEMQTNLDAESVIEDPALPSMGSDTSPGLMGEEPAAVRHDNVMTEPAPGGEEDEEIYPDMAPPEGQTEGTDAASFAAEKHGDGYLRLVVSVDRDKMIVIDASVVAGPLIEQPDLTGQMAYQVLIGGQRIAGEAFADLCVESGFAPPDDPSVGHKIAELTSFEFVVRISRSEVTLEQLDELEIELVRPNTTTELAEVTTSKPGVSFAAAAADAGIDPPKIIARMAGLNVGDLSPTAAESVRKGLR